MKRSDFAVGMTFLALCLCGCFKFESQSATELTKEELERKIAEANNWKSVSLDEGKQYGFAVTAVTESGEELKVDVQKTDKGIRTKWTNADGQGGGESTHEWNWSIRFP
jgi:hypothetical protein